jgi:hypothetical protein
MPAAAGFRQRSAWSRCPHVDVCDDKFVYIDSYAATGRFTPMAWTDIAARLGDLARDQPEFAHMADIVASVLACGGADRLAGHTSRHDLVVTPRPVPEPPIETVVVRAPSSGRVGPGAVLIEHRSRTGHDEWIARPAGEAVDLFWRFMIEKFGVAPARPGGGCQSR